MWAERPKPEECRSKEVLKLRTEESYAERKKPIA